MQSPANVTIELRRMPMARKVTSKRVAKKASKVLRDKGTKGDAKSSAGSALSQREKLGRKKKK